MNEIQFLIDLKKRIDLVNLNEGKQQSALCGLSDYIKERLIFLGCKIINPKEITKDKDDGDKHNGEKRKRNK